MAFIVAKIDVRFATATAHRAATNSPNLMNNLWVGVHGIESHSDGRKT